MASTFSSLAQATRCLWAKSGDNSGHRLLPHMLDVAAVAEAIVMRESHQTKLWVAATFDLPVERVARWVAAFAGAHDFGKAIPGFQVKWPEGKLVDEGAGLPFFPSAVLQADRHDWASAVLLRAELANRFPEAGWTLAVSQAIGAHHGYFPSIQEMRGGKARPVYEHAVWSSARAELFDVYFATLLPGDPPKQNELPLHVLAWLAGLTSVADWIGSNCEWFPMGERAEIIADHHTKALALAEHALDAIGWPCHQPLLPRSAEVNTLLGRVLNREVVEARPLQVVADRLLNHVDGPALLIVEAPMGEGKTELAFLAHLRLQAANGHRGLYVALPTQATGNAMFDRALTFLRGFSSGLHLDIQLAHGGSMLDERLLLLRGIDGSAKESISCSAWFSQRKRPLLSPYGIGTIDQALFAVLNVKHHFVRLWGLANRVVVLDEVHAYDTYTSGLIEALLRWLKAMNCSVVLMSATLPAKRRHEFLQAWGVATEEAAELNIAYPRLVLSTKGRLQAEAVACRSLVPIGVSSIAEDLPSMVAAVMEKLEGGGCGVVIVNTVQRAQEFFSILKSLLEDDTELLLFHARFPADERGTRERAVLQRFGSDANRPTRALLVATQVVEQSLDIDFDFMFSDLAPVDLLLQRAGRLHRHERERPNAHRAPRLIVAGFQQDRLPELMKTAWGFVYDPYVLYRTWAIAGPEAVWHLPSDIDRLVQAVYASDPLEAEERDEYLKTLDQALGKHLAMVQEQRRHASNVALDAAADAANAYLTKPRANEEGDGEGRQVVTRLGADSIAVVPVFVGDSGWQLQAGDAIFDPQIEPSHEQAKRIFGRQLRISRKDLVNAILAQPVVPAFEAHPLLRNLRPLLLTDGAATFERLRVRLDSELGLIYEQSNKEVI